MTGDFMEEICLFRITHIDNIPHILQHGITHGASHRANPNFIPIGDVSLISKRNSTFEYIPLYLWYRMPMPYVLQNGFNGVTPVSPSDIVYCVSSVTQVMSFTTDFIFTDGHAVDKLSTQYSARDIHQIKELLDWGAIKFNTGRRLRIWIRNEEKRRSFWCTQMSLAMQLYGIWFLIKHQNKT
jgi:hypothetical protein